MSEGVIVWECPGCGQPIEPGDDYVGAVAITHDAPRLRLFHWTGP